MFVLRIDEIGRRLTSAVRSSRRRGGQAPLRSWRHEDPRIDHNSAGAGCYRYRFANAEFDEAQSLLWVSGGAVAVEPLPLQLLAVLLQSPDEVVTRAELFGALWQDRPTVDHVLANAVSKLRRALGDDAGTRLLNVPRIGYRLAGPVERIAVGRRQFTALNLAAGLPVPGLEDFLLVRPLGDAAGSTTWLAAHRRLGQRWVFKFASDGERLAALKREFTVCRLLLKELGPRDDLAQLRASDFSGTPQFIAYDDAGTDLCSWARQDDRLAALDIDSRLALFLDIARAVAAAHGVGVLHRDLKPGNVLIAADADRARPGRPRRVRLSDFGSSQLLSPDRLAALGVTAMGMTVNDTDARLLGTTPHYLAPELLTGSSASMRTDLYALGLMLYQLLAGDLTRPLATGWEHDIADPLLVDDVRAATEGRPERRLASVAQLIERLQTLDSRRRQRNVASAVARQAAVTAGKLQALRARRPWVIALCVCLTLGGLGAVWFGIQARAAQGRAEAASVRARAINDFLNEDVLQAANLEGSAQGRSLAAIDLIARASDRAGERFKDDPTVLAQVRRQLGDLYLGLSFGDQAEYEYRRAIAVLLGWVRPDDTELLSARYGLARALTGRGRPLAALDALSAADQAAGPQARTGRPALVLRALQARTQVLLDARRYTDARPSAEQFVRLADAPIEDGRLDNRRRIEARALYGEVLLGLGDAARAAALMDELAGAPFHARPAAVAVLVHARLRLVDEQLAQDRSGAAEQSLAGLRDAVQRDAAADPLLSGLVERAWFELDRKTGRREDAYRASAAALQAMSAALGERHSLVTNARMNLALAELDLGRPADALRDFTAARARINADGNHQVELLAIDLGRARAQATLSRSADVPPRPGAAPPGRDRTVGKLASTGTRLGGVTP